MNSNIFYESAYPFIAKVSKSIVDKKLDSDSVRENILLLAVGIEKLLKGIIYSINPLYVLEKPDFYNSVQIEYMGKIKNKDSNTFKEPEDNVIALQQSIVRSMVFSESVYKYQGVLWQLKSIRDNIAHHHKDKVNIDKAKILLERDFYPLLKAISDEFNLKGKTKFFNNAISQLSEISSNLQKDVKEKIKLRIDGARSHWETLKNNVTYDKNKCLDNLKNELKIKDIAFPCQCPSCDNNGIVYTSPIFQFNSYLLDMEQVGEKIEGFKCFYCHLNIVDYEELEDLQISPNKQKKIELLSDIELG